MSSKSGAKSIELPGEHAVFRNLKNAKRFAIDIGGSLTKIAYYSTVSYKRACYDYTSQQSVTDDENSSSECQSFPETRIEGARLHFVKFETKHIETCLSFVKDNLIGSRDFMRGKSIKATGGGAYKYRELITNTLGLTVDMEDEMECLIKGCNFLLKNIPDEVFEYDKHNQPEYKFHSSDPNVFPYLLVNIGSGISIMKVESDDNYERIGGSAMGGGTFWGLGSLLTKAKGFDELLKLAEQGDHRNVDMLVKDIYDGDYGAIGLTSDTIACSFGKAMHSTRDKAFNPGQFNETDIARSLLFMISNDIGQLASLYAILHGLKRIYFGGYFLRGHPVSMHTISYAINYWSKGKVQALFLRHEGYLGSIGAFLKGAEEYDTFKYSWGENYAGSSGLRSPTPGHLGNSGKTDALIDQLEMDRYDWQLVYCPLLRDPERYLPDTVDLTQDEEARVYWLKCFEDAIDKFVDVAISSQPHKSDTVCRAKEFRDKYLGRLHYLRTHPFAYGNLTVRSLLDMREHCLKEVDLTDPYYKQKRLENESALKLFPKRIEYLDSLEKMRDRYTALVVGVLAGNVFDWGAKEVAKLMQNPDGLGFDDARNKLQDRPWLVDDLDAWLDRLDTNLHAPHKCAAIFVDNSGMDILLGVLPFAREMLRRGTKVILCANNTPVLNDVTHVELKLLLQRVGGLCPIIGDAIKEKRIVVLDSGQGSPCLDLSRLNRDVAVTISEWETDLVVIEGMGRAIHTNLHARFTCDAIKAAVIKNQWLAQRLGGDMFGVVFQFEPASPDGATVAAAS